MAVLKNRAKMSTSTTGTGTITLGSAESGYQTFGDAGVANADVVRYVIEDSGAWEIGTGTYTATGTTLTRTVSESSNSGSAISLSGSAIVFVGVAAEDILQPANNLSDLASASTARTNLGLGTAATTAATAYATASQGTNADAALPKSGGALTGAVTTNSTFDGRDVSVDGSKLDGIETGATADQTGAQIKTAYQAEANAFTDAQFTKLAGIEASADVTDATNVTAAGALMDSEVTNLAQVKAFSSADYATAAQGTLANSSVQPNDNATLGNVSVTSLGVTGTVDGRDVAADGTKLDTVETNADVTDATNVTAAGALMDSEVTNLAQVKAFSSADYATAAQGSTADAALPKSGGAMTGAITTNSTFDGRDVAADGTKLDYITVTQAVSLDQMEIDIAALANGMVYKGDWSAASGSFPGSGAAQTGWFYYVSGAGTVNGITFAIGDNIIATTDNASSTTYSGNWSKHDQTDAVTSVAGLNGSITKSALLSNLNVEDGATADQTGAQIKTAYEAQANAFTDAQFTKLGGIETGATADQTGAQIKTAYEAQTSAFTDAQFTKLAGIETAADVTDATNVTSAGALMDSEVTNLAQVKAFSSADYATAAQGTLAANALPKSGGALTGAVTTSSTFDGRNVSVDGAKLDGIETGATADQTAAQIKTAYESNANTNEFSDAEQTKLSGIEASADVTDATNVTAAGALMDSEVTNLAQVKAFSSADYATAAQGTLAANALPKSGGALTGAVTTSSTFDGRNVSVDGAKLDGIATGATNVTNNNQLTNGAGYTTNVGDITGVTAGSGITGGGTSGTVTVSHADTSSQASSNNSGRTYIQDVTLDTYGHVTGLATATETVVNTTYSAGTALDLSGTTFNVDLSELSTSTTNGDGDYFIVTDTSNAQRKLTKGNINNSGFNNDAGFTTNVGDITGVTAGSGITGGGTSGTVTVSHADTSTQASLTALTGAAVVSDIDLDTYGHVTSLATRDLTLLNLGYTGATDANNITNNNQLTNGAGYTTNVGDITGVTAGSNLTGGGTSGTVSLALVSGPTFSATVTANAFAGDGSALTGIASSASGGGTNDVFWENAQNVTTNYTITNGKNAMSAGPITINSGVTVTVGAGETWTVV